MIWYSQNKLVKKTTLEGPNISLWWKDKIIPCNLFRGHFFWFCKKLKALLSDFIDKYFKHIKFSGSICRRAYETKN